MDLAATVRDEVSRYKQPSNIDYQFQFHIDKVCIMSTSRSETSTVMGQPGTAKEMYTLGN